MILTLLAAALACSPGTQPARTHGKPVCVPAKVAAPLIEPPAAPHGAQPGKTHKLEKPTGPLAYRDETFRGSLFVVNRYPALPANDLTVERIRATCSDSCILLTRPSSRTVLRDLDLTGTGDKPYKAGIKLDNGASDVLIERVTARGFTSTQPKGYPNADGFATELTNARITFRDVVAEDNTDGGLDMKSSETLLDRVRVARNRYGVRLRVAGRATTLYADSNRNANVYIKPGADWTIDRLELAGPAPKQGDVFLDGAGPARLTIGSCSRPLVLSASAKRYATLTLGPGCKVLP